MVADGQGSIPARAGETISGVALPGFKRVYPRTGGGNLCRLRLGGNSYGLSPHGRGKPALIRPATNSSRSIPARAGETLVNPNADIADRVYPRTGGGNINHAPRSSANWGLSPHGRGKQPTPP